jgi:SAM-dependent methyltransferase
VSDKTFAAAWQAYLLAGPDAAGRRLEPSEDLAFWEGYASRYDDGGRDASAAQTLALIEPFVRRDDTVLDVGAGTGRFTLPLAARARRVTALDASPHMLEVLHRKLATRNVENVEPVLGDLTGTALRPHDVVLAAWSLYRQVDLPAALQALVQATRRTLIVVSGASPHTPHRRLVLDIWRSDGEFRIPSHLYVAGALWEMGLHAEARLAWEQHRVVAGSPHEAARLLAPRNAALEEVARFAERLTPLLRHEGEHWVYEYESPVGIVIWERRP